MEPTFAFVIPIGGHGPVDPGFGRPGGGWDPTDPGFGNRPGGPTDPGYGRPGGGPGHPSGQPIPVPPPGIWPAPPGPDQGLPPLNPGAPDQTLPIVPGIPIYPAHPIVPIGGDPAHPIELPPGSVWPPLPPQITGKVYALVIVYGIGYRWVVIDTTLVAKPK
jgi:hypothetical protein